MNAVIRLATAADLAAINDIYNHYVPISACTFQTELEPLDSRRVWFEAHDSRHPITVLESGNVVVGWCSLSPFRNRAAYAFTVEDSVYVRHDLLGRGLGRMLLADLIARAVAIGHHTVLACIAADEQASIELHRRLAFTPCARLEQVGRKFDRWVDVVWMQRMLQR